MVSGAPFSGAFADQHGAHLSVEFDAAEVSAARLSESADAEGVSGAAGPFRTATVTPEPDGRSPGRPMTVVGREDPGEGVDEVRLLDGRWPARPGELVLSAGASLVPVLGAEVVLTGLPGDPALTVVAPARSVTGTADAWVVPSQMPALTAPGGGGYQMLYRFADADSGAAIAAGRRAGRLRTVDALAVGRTTSTGRGRWAARLAGRLPLPQPVALGLTRPFARPARVLAMGTAVLFGTVTFTVGMAASLGEVMEARAHDVADVTVPAPPPDFAPPLPGEEKRPAADPAAVAAAGSAAGPAELLPLALGGLLIATAGALLPAGWAARTRTATALRTE